MNRLPPSIPSGLHPDDIIPFDMARVFLKHYLCTFKTESTDEFEGALKKENIGPEQRKVIAEIYAELHLNGWYPCGIVKNEFDAYSIKWAYSVSKPQRVDDLPAKMTPAEARVYVAEQFEATGKAV
jgi:hypothetical protein